MVLSASAALRVLSLAGSSARRRSIGAVSSPDCSLSHRTVAVARSAVSSLLAVRCRSSALADRCSRSAFTRSSSMATRSVSTSALPPPSRCARTSSCVRAATAADACVELGL
jgi:hypothetical protein